MGAYSAHRNRRETCGGGNRGTAVERSVTSVERRGADASGAQRTFRHRFLTGAFTMPPFPPGHRAVSPVVRGSTRAGVHGTHTGAGRNGLNSGNSDGCWVIQFQYPGIVRAYSQ